MAFQPLLPLSWKETSPGIFHRPIDEIEQFYTTIAKIYEKIGHTCFAITACATISLPLTSLSSIDRSGLDAKLEHVLRSAWKKLRYDHPTLAATISYDLSTKSLTKIYKNLAGEDELEEWMKGTFRVVDNGQSGLEFANTDPDFGHLATLFIVTPPISPNENTQECLKRDIVFRSPHDLIDGIGTLMFFDNFFRHVAAAYDSDYSKVEVKFGDESKNLSPSLNIAADIPKPNDEQLNKFAQLQKITSAASKDAEVLGFRVPLNSAPIPGNSKYIPLYFTASETSSILARCKALKVTPTQIFHTGIALALRNIQEWTNEERHAKYISYSLINLRSYLKPPYNTPAYAAGVYHSVSAGKLIVDLTIPSLSSPPTTETTIEDFRSALKQVSAFYRNGAVDEDYLAIVPTILKEGAPQYPETTPEVPPPNKTASASLSSMGIIGRIIQPKHGVFEIEHPWVMGAEYSTGIGVFLGTWKGEMALSAGYNAAYHDEEEVMKFLNGIKQIVFDGMEAQVADVAY